jgi:predicted DNA-binding transcriptional regulator AlpA
MPSIVTPYLTPDEAALFLRLSRRTLDNLRSLGSGPRYRRHGGRVFYHKQDVEDWSARVAVRSRTVNRLAAGTNLDAGTTDQLELPFTHDLIQTFRKAS